MLEFASGVINVLEKRVFDKLDQERMLKSPNRERAFAVLFDTDLGKIASAEKEVEKIIDQDISLLKNTLARLLQEQEGLFWFLFLKFDALNLKVSLKKAFSQNFSRQMTRASKALSHNLD